MKILCILSEESKHISKGNTYEIRQESLDKREVLLTNDKEYVVWVEKKHFDI